MIFHLFQQKIQGTRLNSLNYKTTEECVQQRYHTSVTVSKLASIQDIGDL